MADGGLGVHHVEHPLKRHSWDDHSGRRVFVYRLGEKLDASPLASISLATGRVDSVSRSPCALVSSHGVAISGILKRSFFQRANGVGAKPAIPSRQ